MFQMIQAHLMMLHGRQCPKCHRLAVILPPRPRETVRCPHCRAEIPPRVER